MNGKIFYIENEGIQFATQRKTLIGRDSFIDEIAKKYNRKTVEIVYSVITSRFPKRIHAIIIEGFQMKVFLSFWRMLSSNIFRFISNNLN